MGALLTRSMSGKGAAEAAAAESSEELSALCITFGAGQFVQRDIHPSVGASSGRGKQCGMCAACIMFSKNGTAVQKKRRKNWK